MSMADRLVEIDIFHMYNDYATSIDTCNFARHNKHYQRIYYALNTLLFTYPTNQILTSLHPESVVLEFSVKPSLGEGLV